LTWKSYPTCLTLSYHYDKGGEYSHGTHISGRCSGTGSSYLLESEDTKLLIDFGMFQGKEEDWNYQPLDIRAKEINALLLTHAHLDHSGRIPVLVKNGFRGPIFATPPTIELTKLLWEDTVKLMKEEKERLDRKRRRQDKPPVELLFDEDDIDEASKLFVPLPWNQN